MTSIVTSCQLLILKKKYLLFVQKTEDNNVWPLLRIIV